MTVKPTHAPRVLVIGAGVGGLTTAALLAQAGYPVTVLEAQTYPGGSAGTFYHKGYRFDAGATVAGGFQPDGPHALIARQLGIRWPVRLHEPAWVVHLPDRDVALTRDNADVLARFPGTEAFWDEQQRVADLCWSMAAQGLPWPPQSLAELWQLARVGLTNFPHDLRLVPHALMNAHQWLRWRGLADNPAFVRFIDAQLLIAAQTTSRRANALYSATALDLARQGVYHVERGIGSIAETLVGAVEGYGRQVLYRQRVSRIAVENGRVTGVWSRQGRRTSRETFFPAEFVVGNLTPWSLDTLLGEGSPASLRAEVQSRRQESGAFVLHLGIRAAALPPDLPDHHQIVTDYEGPLGEGRSIFLSISPTWDLSRAPDGYRAVTVTTHTAVQPWWDLLAQDENAYYERKQHYADEILAAIDRVIPGFRAGLDLVLPGSPVTYQFFTGRHLGMVGGFPQTSLFRARGPHVGLPNLRLVGDSIFPGQSTAGVTLGAIRVANDIKRVLKPVPAVLSLPPHHIETSAQ